MLQKVLLFISSKFW